VEIRDGFSHSGSRNVGGLGSIYAPSRWDSACASAAARGTPVLVNWYVLPMRRPCFVINPLLMCFASLLKAVQQQQGGIRRWQRRARLCAQHDHLASQIERKEIGGGGCLFHDGGRSHRGGAGAPQRIGGDQLLPGAKMRRDDFMRPGCRELVRADFHVDLDDIGRSVVGHGSDSATIGAGMPSVARWPQPKELRRL
jgi:hypothetical protein